MPTRTDPHPVTFNGWTFRLRPASSGTARLFLLLHGWKGDETSMRIFARSLPDAYAVLAPRGLHVEPTGGYTWRRIIPGSSWRLPSLDDLRPSADALVRFVDEWSAPAGVDAAQFDAAGFSQGAALAYALALLHPGRVRMFAALSGFLPAGSEVPLAAHALDGKCVFVAHGRQDDIVPVEWARQTVVSLEASGAQVAYCESDGGHRVGKERLKGMEAFFGRVL
ncbi:MAG: phospholipase/carboxylesterase [Anaerolineaceae bacterium]|nr:MAG: phospholipase/carboxylesterase [Anaerolineaceae bacterium]